MKINHESAAIPAPLGGGSRRARSRWAAGAPAARQSGACPWWAGGLQPHATAAHASLAPGGRVGSSHVPERRGCPLPPHTIFLIYRIEDVFLCISGYVDSKKGI